MKLKLLIISVFVLIAALVAVQNANYVVFRLLFFVMDIPLTIIMVAFFAFGMLTGIFIAYKRKQKTIKN